MVDLLLEQQLALENQSLMWGMARYRKNLERAEPGSMSPERTIIAAALEGLTATIKDWLQKARAGEPVQAPTGWKFVEMLGAETTAIVVMRTLLWRLRHQNQVPFTALAITVGSTIIGSINYAEIVKQLPHMKRKMDLMLRKNKPDYRLSVIQRTAKKNSHVCEFTAASKVEQCRLGGTLLKQALEITSIAECLLVSEATRHRWMIRRTDAFLEYMRSAELRRSLMSPMHQPMVIPPVPYDPTGHGGFLTPGMREPLVKSRGKDEIPQPMLSAINALQRTPWETNHFVMRVAQECLTRGVDIFDFERIEQVDRRKPPERIIPKDQWSTPEFKEYRHAMFAWHTARNQAATREICVRMTVEMAQRFAEYDKFYYVYQVDTRGRAYPVSTCFHPQSEDFSRGLLRFHEGKALGDTGFYWLRVHAASMHEGGSLKLDKQPFDVRAKWAWDHFVDIADVARDPLGIGWNLWKQAANPWQFLAVAEEFERIRLSRGRERIEDFVSRIPVSMDGTCNGLQHFAALMKDAKAATHVGMVPALKPVDLYSAIADSINDELKDDNSDMACKWYKKVTRKLIKRNIMTTPYGVTAYGRKNQLLEQFSDIKDPVEKGMDDASFIAEKVETALTNLVSAAPVAMRFFRECSDVVADEGKAPVWTSPTGFRVLQDLPKVKSYQGKVCGYTLSFIDDIPGSVHPRKNRNSIAPNFVHSMDAAHMMLTVNNLVSRGVTSFAMIHDSYGTHATDVDLLHKALRVEFVRMYQTDWMKAFRDGMQAQVNTPLPPLPKFGDYDVKQVLDATYFFS